MPCAARQPRPARNSLRSLRSLRSDSRAESVLEAGCRPRRSWLCCSAPPNGANSRNSQVPNSPDFNPLRRFPAVAPFGGAEQRSAVGRTRSVLRELTRDCCLTGANAVSAGSSIPSPPERAAQGTPGKARGAGVGAALLVPFGKTKGTPGAGRTAPAGSQKRTSATKARRHTDAGPQAGRADRRSVKPPPLPPPCCPSPPPPPPWSTTAQRSG